jgi:hypothetical protein
MFVVFYTVNLYVFLYLWLVPHPAVFMTGMRGMYVCRPVYVDGQLLPNFYMIVPFLKL